MRLWTRVLATAMADLCEDRLTLAELDVAQHAHKSTYWEIDESPVDLAEALAAEGNQLGLHLPAADPSLSAVLHRRGIAAPVATAPVGSVLRLLDGSLAYRLDAGAMESFEDGFALIEFSADRYDAAWLIPGVAYFYEA